MQPKTDKIQYSFPEQRGSFDVMQSPEFVKQANLRIGEQTSARLGLQEYFRNVEPSKIIIDTTTLADSAPASPNARPEQLTFADYERSLTHIGNWLAYDRQEVGNNGLPV